MSTGKVRSEPAWDDITAFEVSKHLGLELELHVGTDPLDFLLGCFDHFLVSDLYVTVSSQSGPITSPFFNEFLPIDRCFSDVLGTPSTLQIGKSNVSPVSNDMNEPALGKDLRKQGNVRDKARRFLAVTPLAVLFRIDFVYATRGTGKVKRRIFPHSLCDVLSVNSPTLESMVSQQFGQVLLEIQALRRLKLRPSQSHRDGEMRFVRNRHLRV